MRTTHTRMPWHQPGRSVLRWLVWAAATAVIMSAITGISRASAAAMHISLDYRAAAPYSYDHLTGGGAWDDRTVGKDADIVPSLEGGDFACGDIVTLLTQVNVADTADAAAAAPITAELDYQFLMDTTGQSGVAVGDIVSVGVNYGSIADLIAGENSVDDGFIDDGGSTATLLSESTTGPMFQPGSLLRGTVSVTDLERAEVVIVRIDVRLFCKPGSNPTGNLQADITAGRVTHVNGDNGVNPPEALSVGNQTIPFRQFGEIATPAISVQKTVVSAAGSCPGSESLVAEPGAQVKYCYVLTNPSLTPRSAGAPLFNVTLVDDYGTPNNPADDLQIALVSGLSDIDLDGYADDLAAGASATGTFVTVVTGSNGSTLTNTATALGYASPEAGTSYSATDTAVVTFAITALPAIDIQKSPDYQMVYYGDYATFQILVTNSGNVALTDVSVTDPLAPPCDRTIGSLAVGEQVSYSCTFGPVRASFENTATATGLYGTAQVQDSDTAYVEDDVLPDIEVSKTADPVVVPETGGFVIFTVVVSNVNGEIVDLISLNDDRFGDLDGQGSCSVPQTLGEQASYTCTFTKWLVSDSLTGHTNVVTAVAQDAQANRDTATDDATVTFYDIAPVIEVTKTADPVEVPETGGDVTFALSIHNPGPEDVTLTSLVDDRFGDLDGQGTCDVPQAILIGESYNCTFTRRLASDSLTPHTNVVTASAVDDESSQASDTDDARVTFSDVAPTIDVSKTPDVESVPETGGDVTYTVLVENSGPEDVTLTSLVDDRFGDLDGQGTCDVPQTILIGGSYSCTFTQRLASDSLTAHANVVTGSAVDDEGTPATDSDDARITFTDVAPAIEVIKTANPVSVPETGGDVTFTVRVNNSGPEDVTLTSLVDDRFGDLDGQGTCDVPQTVLIGRSYSCTFTKRLASDALTAHVNVVTATAVDDDGSQATDTDDERVTFADVLPDITVDKSVTPDRVTFSGGYVDYTIRITNNSGEALTLTSLADSRLSLSPQCSVLIGQVIAPSGYLECSILQVWVSGDPDGSLINTATAIASDNDGNSDTASDSATVYFWWYGRTPGYWKNHPDAWIGFSPSATLVSVFNIPASLKTGGRLDLTAPIGEDTLMNALAYKGGSNLKGAAQILLRAATAALLNEAMYGDLYPPSPSVSALILRINNVLMTESRSAYLQLATELDYWNNANHSELP